MALTARAEGGSGLTVRALAAPVVGDAGGDARGAAVAGTATDFALAVVAGDSCRVLQAAVMDVTAIPAMSPIDHILECAPAIASFSHARTSGQT